MMEIKWTDLVEVMNRAKAIADADFRSVYMYVENTGKIWWTPSREHVPDGAISILLEPSFRQSDD